MPPRGGRNPPSGSSSTRDTRSGPRPNRGGIQKRRGGGPSRDSDGDLDMDSVASGRGGGARRGGRGGSLSARALGQGSGSKALDVINKTIAGEQGFSARVTNGAPRSTRNPRNNPGLKWLKVHGLQQSKAAQNEGGGLKDLLAFLERKSSAQSKRPIAIKKSRIEGDLVYIGASAEDVEEILKINGFTFAGAQLKIDESPNNNQASSSTAQGSVSSGAQETRAKLQEILNQRYEQPAKLLRLSQLDQDPELVRLGMFETKERAEKTFHVIMVICDSFFKSAHQKREAIESISLANNGIDDVSQVATMADTFPDLKNLELSNNQFTTIASLQNWKNKLRELQTIYVAGNPLVINEPSYKEQLMQWYPKLQFVDGFQVRTAEQVAAAVAATKPKPIPQHGPDFRDANGIGEAFLLEFFEGFDSNRPALLAKYYDDSSLFSLAVDAESVRGPNAPPPMSWKPYIKYSRNLLKITNPPTRVQRLFKGAAVIGDLWKMLPPTKHPDLKTELPKYIMDCHIMPGLVDPSNQSQKGVDGLIVSVHGEFDEPDRETGQVGKRSFSRTFILGPGLPGRNMIRVASDMLALRAANPLPNMHAQEPVAQIPQTPEQQEQARKQSLIAELSRQTAMTATYSELCLSEVGWDLVKGLAIFNERRSQLPPDAFMTPS